MKNTAIQEAMRDTRGQPRFPHSSTTRQHDSRCRRGVSVDTKDVHDFPEQPFVSRYIPFPHHWRRLVVRIPIGSARFLARYRRTSYVTAIVVQDIVRESIDAAAGFLARGVRLLRAVPVPITTNVCYPCNRIPINNSGQQQDGSFSYDPPFEGHANGLFSCHASVVAVVVGVPFVVAGALRRGQPRSVVVFHIYARDVNVTTFFQRLNRYRAGFPRVVWILVLRLLLCCRRQ
mmetsp:Transcript_26242/g.72049  ORF Transcript_26242/g.72049 Transcript_26242/m.72049 type:complete len:232 (+) Transcript_26242:4358-5053(+)